MSEIAIPEAAIRLAAEAIEEASILKVGHDLGTIHRDDIAEQGLRAAAPLIVAAELDQQADRIQHSAGAWGDPKPGTAAYSMAGVLTDVAVELRLRAGELRGES